MPVIVCISAFAALVSMGGAPLASINMGKGDKEKAENILGNCTTYFDCFNINFDFLSFW